MLIPQIHVPFVLNENPRNVSVSTLENGATQWPPRSYIPYLLIPELTRLCQRADQIQGGVEENPYQIHEVPVNCGGLNWILFFIIEAFTAVSPDNRQQDQARQNVEGMHTCHHKEHRTCRSGGRR